MMGELLQDPKGVEAGGGLKGMGLLPIQTVFAGEKDENPSYRELLKGCLEV